MCAAKAPRMFEDTRVAVCIPCYNEAMTIGRMIAELKALLPAAQIVVCDNASTDATLAVARKAGATVLQEFRQGKGYAVQRLFAAVEADVYVMVDGDATYDLPSLPAMIARLLDERLGMLVGARVPTETACYRSNHTWGNRVFNLILATLFGAHFDDIFSGYRVFSRAFVKSFPVNAGGFTIESAMAVHALQLRLPCAEVPTPYYARVEGSHSKLSTWKDGFRILLYLARLFVTERPFVFYGLLGAAFAVAALAMFVPLLATYFATGLVPRIPTLIVVGSLAVGGLLCGVTGLILQAVATARKEAKQLAYLRG